MAHLLLMKGTIKAKVKYTMKRTPNSTIITSNFFMRYLIICSLLHSFFKLVVSIFHSQVHFHLLTFSSDMLNFLHSIVGLNSIISFVPHHLLKLTFDKSLTSLTIIFGLVEALIDDISRPIFKIPK